MNAVGTLYAGGQEFFLLDKQPVQVDVFGATFRCIQKNSLSFEDCYDDPVVLVTADKYAIVCEEGELVDPENYMDALFDVHDAVLEEA